MKKPCPLQLKTLWDFLGWDVSKLLAPEPLRGAKRKVQAALVLLCRDLDCAEAPGVVVDDLDVAQLDAARGEPLERSHDVDVPGVGGPVEHRLEHRGEADHDPEDARRQLAAVPQLERVGEARLV